MRRWATVMMMAPATTITKAPSRARTPSHWSLVSAPGSNPKAPATKPMSRIGELATTHRNACGIWARIPAVMMSETPLPMPYLSICSPSQVRKMLPAVIAVIAMTHQTGFEAQLA